MSRHLYLIGCSGVGMVWIADYALQMGWQVSGTDLSETATVKRLRAAGMNIHVGADVAAIPADITEVIITAAITPSAPHYPELEEVLRRGVPVVKRSEWIGALTRQKFTIAIAGAHGKTTTTAMVGWILAQAGLDPTVFVGADIPAWNNVTKIGKSDYLVLEADEFDRSFHRFSPQIAVVLNIDKDHTDYYSGGLPEIEQSYRRFLRNLPSGVHAQSRGVGVVIGHGKDGRVRKVARGFKYKFRWYDDQHLYPGIHVPQPGKHYLMNATAAAKVAQELGISHEVIKQALAIFPGAGRRFEYLGTWNKAELYDDYGHHPTEVQATLQAVRERWPRGGKQKVTLVFQPHQKARTKELLKEFGRCFDQFPPDQLILAPIYHVAGREDGIEITSQDIAEQINRAAHPAMQLSVAANNQELEQMVRAAMERDGIVMIMGAGDIRVMVDGWRGSRAVPSYWFANVLGTTLTSMRVGGPVRYLARPHTEAELAETADCAHAMQLPIRVLGGGSNLILPDQGFAGVLVQPQFKEIKVVEGYDVELAELRNQPASQVRYSQEPGYLALQTTAQAQGTTRFLQLGAGVPWGQAVMQSLNLNLVGLHWYARIPCQVGGAVYNNIHGERHFFSESIVAVSSYNLQTKQQITRTAAELDFGYDRSVFHAHPGEVITSVVCALEEVAPEEAAAAKQQYIEWTTHKTQVQPVGANCGSVFQNLHPDERPAGQESLAAAWYIDSLGLRGLRVGGMEVSAQHANFISNMSGGTQADFRALVTQIREKVRAAYGFWLTLEAECINERGEREQNV